MAKKQATIKKVKKKKWYPVISPKYLGSRVLGESLLGDSLEMKGRHITMNLMNIIGDPKKQTINLSFKIKDVREGQGQTETVKYELMPSAVKRLVRRGRSKVDDSFKIKTKEGRIIVKTLIITNHIVYKSIQNKLRMTVRGLMKKFLSEQRFENSVEELLKNGIYKNYKSQLSKITPIRTFNVRVLKLIKDEDAVLEEELEVKPNKEVEEKKETPKEAESDEVASESVKEEKKEEKKAKVEKKAKKEEKKTDSKDSKPKKK